MSCEIQRLAIVPEVCGGRRRRRGLPQPKHDATPAASGPQSSSQCVQQKQAAPQPKGSTYEFITGVQASKTNSARTGAAAGKKAIKGTQKDEFDITASSEKTPAASGQPSSSQKQAAPQPKGSTQASKTDPARTGAAAGKKAIKGTQKDEFDITASSEESELDGEGGATPAASGPPSSSKKPAAPQPKQKTEHAASSAPNSATDCHCTTKCVGRCINAPLPQGTTRIKKTPSNFY